MKQQVVSLKKTLVIFLGIVIVYISTFSAQASDSSQYLLNEVAKLSHNNLPVTNWQQVIVNPNNPQQFFIFNRTGQLYLLDEAISAKAILNLNKTNKEEFSLTAVTLHPNFSLRDQPGYGVIYTAHLELINKKSRTKRLKERSNDYTLSYDAVITEWQFNTASFKWIDESSKREVLRIGLPSSQVFITQLAFNPSLKSWNDNFGFLYISLTGEKSWQKPLYSGVILRINPAKFGLRSFTIPTNNPFLQDNHINDAIYMLGGESISQFIWPSKTSEQLLLAHQYNNSYLLTLAKAGNDWRTGSINSKILYQGAEPISDILAYRGHQLPELRNKLLFLQQKSQRWQISSLVISTAFLHSKNKHEANVEWQFSPNQLSSKSPLTFISKPNAEIVLLDNTNQLLYQLVSDSKQVLSEVNNTVKPKQEVDETSSSNNGLIVSIILILIILAFYFVKRNRISAKKLVRKYFAHLELSESKQQIGLYHRHQRTTDTIIDLANLKNCRVLLNEHSISFINHEVEHGFSEEKEQKLRELLKKEQTNKMIDGKLRQITLRLTDKQNHTYTICLYMRKGDDRITKNSYFKVVDELVDWCWFIAQQVNPEHTEKRELKITPPIVEKTPTNKKSEVLLQNKGITHSGITKPITREKEENAKQVLPQPHKVKTERGTVDTEVVDALEKLVTLQQQGYLTKEEFTKAKTRLLKGLVDKE